MFAQPLELDGVSGGAVDSLLQFLDDLFALHARATSELDARSLNHLTRVDEAVTVKLVCAMEVTLFGDGDANAAEVALAGRGDELV